MDNLINGTYKMNSISKNILKSLGFKYSFLQSDKEQDTYVFTFPLMKHKNHVTLFCEISVCVNDGEVITNVKNNDGSCFVPFYNNQFGLYNFLNEICDKILKKYKELGITKQRREYNRIY